MGNFVSEAILGRPVGQVGFFVSSSSGDDSNPGTQDAPWKTVAKVNAEMGNAIQQGNDIYFKRGDVFSDARLNISVGGTPSDFMILGAYGAGYKPNFPNQIYCNSDSIGNIIVQDLDIGSVTTRFAVAFHKLGVSNIILRRLSVHNGDVGIFLKYVDTYIIEDCIVYNCADNAYVIQGSSEYRIKNGLIQNCISQDNGEGFTLHHDGNVVNPVGSNHILKNCTAINSLGEDGFDISTGSNIQIINCGAYNSSRGFVTGGVDGMVIDGLIVDGAASMCMFIGSGKNIMIKNSTLANAARDTLRIYGHVTNWVENLTIQSCFFMDKPDAVRPLIRIGYDWGVCENNIHMENNVFVSHRDGKLISYSAQSTPDNTNSTYVNNIWWQSNGSPDNFGYIAGVGYIPFDWWQAKYPTDTFQEPLYCINPLGLGGVVLCGIEYNGQDPTHRYECQCVGGVCGWVDLGYDASCEGELPPSGCVDPTGYEGNVICGDPGYGQDPTHRYECQCVGGVCGWVDLGYDASCEELPPPPPPSEIPLWLIPVVIGGIVVYLIGR